MLPLRTARLTVRMMRERDVAGLVAYRNDADVARFQDWELPFTEAAARQLIADQAALDGPADGRWVQLAIEHEGVLVGDLAVGLRHGGTVAALGYSLAAAHQGNGFATEALGALVEALAGAGVHRFVATLDPANVPSMRVLEAVGFTFESHAPKAEWVRGEWVDDVRYAMLADDLAAWRARPRTPPSTVELVEITATDSREWARLVTHHSQERLVAPMLHSFRDALFPEVIDGAPVVPWFRGVLADGERAGFVMLTEATEHHPEPFLWRLLVDRRHQRRGIGERVIALVVQRLRNDGHRSLATSWIGGVPGSPAPFYARLGFVPTGEMDGSETLARLSW